MRRGCTDSNSFATGHGARAVHDGRFRYEASRDEMIAEGFADLRESQRGVFPTGLQCLLFHDFEALRQDRSEFFDQMRPVPGLL